MEKQGDESQAGLLDHHDSEYSEDVQAGRYSRQTGRAGRPVSISAILVVLLVYIAILETVNVAANLQAKPPGTSVDNQPAFMPQGTLEYERRKEWSPPQHPWNLEPSPELDAAWLDLLYAENIRITSKEFDALHENATDRVRIDEGDYPIVMGIFHHLHCLDTIRKVLHWDYYEPLVAGEYKEIWTKEHSDHCIDVIRQVLMCHADTTLYTTMWINDTHRAVDPELKSNKEGLCLKWDGLDQWTRRRALIKGQYHIIPGPYS